MGPGYHTLPLAAGFLALLLTAGGCAGPSDVQSAPSLVGSTVGEVERAWGKPYFAYRDPDSGRQRLVYQFREHGYKLELLIVPMQTLHLYCYRLDIDENGVVIDYETPDFGTSPYASNCLVAFFAGSTADALYLAREHGKLEPLRVRARKGDKVAQAIVAKEFDPTYPLNKQAQEGDVEAWLAWYETSIKGTTGVSQALEIICRGARQDEGGAQLYVAELMTESRWKTLNDERRAQLMSAGFVPENAFAYFWLRQAARNGAAGSEARLAELTAVMDDGEIAMADGWRYDPLTTWERNRIINAMSPSPANATRCPVPWTDPKDSKKMNQLKNAALAAAGNARGAARLGDVGALERIASDGDAEAAAILAVEHDEPSYALALAAAGDQGVGLRVYRRMPKSRRNTPRAWSWLCQSAGAGNAEARREIGYWHRSDRQARARRAVRDELGALGVDPDDTLAYMWYVLADEAGGNAEDSGIPERLRRNVSTEDAARAERMAGEWNPGECPSAEHRLGMPGES